LILGIGARSVRFSQIAAALNVSKPYTFLTVDVFTNRRFGGNQLAVIPDARGLRDEAMQNIAAEFGYSETVFLLPPNDPSNAARARIFTPKYEVPFAGHPSIGAGFVAARLGSLFGRPVGGRIVLEERAGLVPISVIAKDGLPAGAILTAPQALRRGNEVPIETCAACLGLEAADIALGHHPPVIASVGLAFVFVEVHDLQTLARCRPNIAVCEAHLPVDGTDAFHIYCQSADRPGEIRARVFSPLDGVIEDPATGSANAALAALLAELAPGPTVELSVRIEQGVEMGRPSLLEAHASKRNGTVREVRVGGLCVPVMDGTISVDTD
jgi:trans-2,3-dihydro-3-hydroxyanthranilate isomerase